MHRILFSLVLVANHGQTLEQLSEQPASERWKHASIPYFETNEKLLNRFYPKFDHIGGVVVGVSLQQNFSLLVHAQPRYSVIFDINPGVTEVMLPYFGQLMKESPTRRQFVERLLCVPLTNADLTRIIATGHAPELNPRPELLAAQKTYFERNIPHGPETSKWLKPLQEDLWSGIFFTDATLGGGWLSTEANYAMVRRYWMEDRIIGITGDIGGSSVAKLAAWLRERKLTVTGLYLSNIGASVDGHEPGAYFVKLYQTLAQLPHTPQTLVLTAHGGHLTGWVRTFERAEWVYRTLQNVEPPDVVKLVEIPLERITTNPKVPPMDILGPLLKINSPAIQVTQVEAGLKEKP